MSDIVVSRKASNKNSTASVAGGRKLGHKPLTFNTYIHKTLKTVHPKANLKKVAGMQLDAFMKCFACRLSSMARRIANDAGRHTVGVEDVETAVQLLFPPELCKAVMDAGDKAVEAFDDTRETPDGSEEGKKRTKASRCGLQFPPHIAEKFLRLQNSTTQSSASRLSVAQCAPVYMVAVIEQLASILLTGGGDLALEDKRQTITVRHMFLATAHDEELSELMNSLNLTWLGGGVTPFIHGALIPSKEKQRKLAQKRRRARKESGATPTPGVARKALPGTKALRDIRRYQKTTGLLQRKAHFKRFVEEQAGELWGDEKIHYGAGVIEYLQLHIEDQAAQVFRNSVGAMVHAGHETVEPRDVEFVWSFMRPSGIVNQTDVGVDNLAVPGLRRIASRGGVKRISQECYPVIRDIMAFYVSRLLQATFLLMQRQRVKTITLPLLRRGAGMVGVNLPIDIVRRRTRKRGGVREDEDEDVPIPIEEFPDTDTEGGEEETPVSDEDSDEDSEDESNDEDSEDDY